VAGRGVDDARPPRKLGRGLSEVSRVFLSGAEPARGAKPPGAERRAQEAVRAPAAGSSREEGSWLPRSNYVSITSGEGVRGKTLLAASVAYGFQARGRKVALVNADPGRPDLRDVVGGRERGPAWSAEEDAAAVPMVDALAGPGSEAATLEALEAAAREAQTVIIDTSPWVEASAAIWRVAVLSIVVAEPGSEKLKASYLTVKRINSVRPDARIGLVINSVRSYAQGEDCFRKLAEVARKFLKINLRNYGCVLRDAAVSEAYERAVPLVKAFPDSKAAKCIDAITGLILMDQSAIARRRREVSFPECVLRRDRLPALRS
jgi:flagellar biosynthesis protein FlhG